MRDFFEIGKIVKPIGLKGEVKVIPYTKDISRFKNLEYCFIDNSIYNVEKISIRNDFVAIKFKDLNSIESVINLRDKFISVEREKAVELDKDEYFIQDLLNACIFSVDKKFFGKICEVNNYGASDIITIEKDNKFYSFPYVDEIFLSVDLNLGEIIINEQRFLEVLSED